MEHDLARGSVDAALRAGRMRPGIRGRLAALDVQEDDALPNAEGFLLARSPIERRVAVLGAGLVREQHQLLRADALRVDVDDDLGAEMFEVAQAEVDHLDLRPFRRRDHQPGCGEHLGGAITRLSNLSCGQHGVLRPLSHVVRDRRD